MYQYIDILSSHLIVLEKKLLLKISKIPFSIFIEAFYIRKKKHNNVL